jgi:hypothetical protein
MGLVDRRLWENRHMDSAATEAELRDPKGRGWLMRWIRTWRLELYGSLAVPTRLEQDTQAVRFDKKGL